MRRDAPLPTLDEIRDRLAGQGITALGVAPAEVLDRARSALKERGSAGLADSMEFTYRDPERSTDPHRAVDGARSIIVAAMPYAAGVEPEPIRPGWARVARYARADHYEDLRLALRAEARLIRAAGHRAVAFADDNSLVDREAAYLGGLGWFGRNANLLISGAGSFFILGSIVTTADYPRSDPVGDGCGTCSRCEPACPTGAIVAPGVIDARRCLAWLMQKPGTFPVEYREALGDRLYGCDDCQEACPPTVRLSPRSTEALGESGPSHVDVLELLGSDDETLLDRYGRWYLANRDPIWLRRNAVIVLGNTAAPGDGPTVAALQRLAEGDQPMLAEHARWSLERLRERGRAETVEEAAR
jgi:epoxyqueuosine reductase